MKYAVFTAIAFLALALIWFNLSTGFQSAHTDTFEPSTEDLLRASLADPQQDSDSDGLVNWEEDLYGTSKRHADSDGDGISDGQEIIDGTDPATQVQYNPDQLGDIQVIEEDVAGYTFVQNEGARSFEEIAQLLQNGSLQNEAYGNNKLDSPVGPQIQQYKTQLNQLGSIVQNSIVTNSSHNTSLAAFAAGSTTDVYAIELLEKTYAQTQANLATLHIPSQITRNFQSRLAENAALIQAQLEIILEQGSAGYNSDQATAAWLRYGELQGQWVDIVVDIHEFVAANKIAFAADEPGHMFMFAL